MPHSLAQIYLHLIFSTKNREPVIGHEVRDGLQAYIAGILRELVSPMLAAGIVDDHAHILYRQSKALSVSKVVEEVKKGSSKWMKTVGEEYDCFYWQNGYGAFSVSASRLEAVK